MLKALMLRSKIDAKKKELDALRAKGVDFEKREADLETAIAEAQTDEEREVVEAEVNKFDEEKTENDAAVADLAKEVEDLEAELAEVEKAQENKEPAKKPEKAEERKVEFKMETRKFFGMSIQERDAFFARADVTEFLASVRTKMTEKRAVTNAGLLIPEVMLPLLRTVVSANSKLISKVNLKKVNGTARMPIAGAIPEAIWTEACAKLNELALAFNDVEVDAYKVGGYIAICNATLEDSDVDLANEILDTLGKAIAKAVDKAIVYGTGTKMPLGFVTRLAQTAAPAGYSSTARTWVDLHSTNIAQQTATSGVAMFKELVTNSGLVENDYFVNGITWIMNKKTHTKLMAESMDKNASAALVAGMNNSMPVIGGEIVELPFMADGDIAFGYMEAYLLAERAGTQLASSEHYKFVDDQTVFKGTARYDGEPCIAEAFAIVNVNGSAPTTTATFPSDTANA